MKKIYSIVLFLISVSASAQSPDKMSYQAVLRNVDGTLMKDQAVSIQISILQSSATGTTVYQEDHSPSTNLNGLVSLHIGTGNTTSGTFSAIDWSAGPYFLQTDIDPAGGTNYVISSTTELISVPFALYANKADSLVGGITETDPIFNSSVAKGITSSDTTYWNNKLDGYTETDPLFNSSVAKGITSTDTAYWNANQDVDSTNELQSISMNNDTLSLSLGGGDVVLPSNWEKTNNTIVNKSDYVSIGANVTDSSAIVNVTSTNAGVLMPRMTTSQREAIASPANGLLVFDTSTNSFWYYSSLWVELISNNSSGTGTPSSSKTLIYTADGF
jgi:hypothetical protein